MYRFVLFAVLFASVAAAQDAQQELDRNMKEAKAEYDRQQAERVREQMRDKTHDGVARVRGTVGGHDVSVGGDVRNGTPMIDVRISTDKKK